MPSGLTFDLILIALLIVLALWELGVAIWRREQKRLIVVVLGLIGAGVLLYLRAPQWWPDN